MILCCPHPDPVHDPAGDCTIRHCGCQRIQAGVRCGCPYKDCAVQVPNMGDICVACEACVSTYEMEPDTFAR